MIYRRWRRQPWRNLDCGETLDEDTCKDHVSSAQRLLVSLILESFRRFVSVARSLFALEGYKLEKSRKAIRFSDPGVW